MTPPLRPRSVVRRTAPGGARLAALAGLLALGACGPGDPGGGPVTRDRFEPLVKSISEPTDGLLNEIRVD